MREKDLPLDRTKHACYTKNVKKCGQKLLHRMEYILLVSMKKETK